MSQIKRETAIICSVRAIIKGNFVKTEGWAPSYFETEAGNISRVNITGVVISKQDDKGMILDDGTDRIVIRSFETNLPSNISIGDLTTVIGRPRMYNEEKYVLPEIIKKTSPKWAEFRKIQVSLTPKKKVSAQPKHKIIVEEEPRQINHYQRIIEFVNDLDSGNGADASEVVKRLGVDNAEELIKRLIEEGEIFEPKAGKLKVL